MKTLVLCIRCYGKINRNVYSGKGCRQKGCLFKSCDGMLLLKVHFGLIGSCFLVIISCCQFKRSGTETMRYKPNICTLSHHSNTGLQNLIYKLIHSFVNWVAFDG